MMRMQSQRKPPPWLLQLHLIPYKEAVKPHSRMTNEQFPKALLRLLIYCSGMQLSLLNTLVSVKHSHHPSLTFGYLFYSPYDHPASPRCAYFRDFGPFPDLLVALTALILLWHSPARSFTILHLLQLTQ